MKRAKFGIAVIAATTLLLTASPAMAVVDAAQISTATKKKKTTKKKATPIYYATMNDGFRAKCTIVGTAGSDKIQGTPGDDVICGLGGNDKIYGNGGNDFIDGGTGNDLILGGEGDDLITGSTGGDKIDGGNGDDLQNGGDGADTLSGSLGFDQLNGENGNDKIVGGTGDDYLIGEMGKDTLLGESGNDELNGGEGKDYLVGGEGINSCTTDTNDRGPSGCYFDNSTPSISEIWTSPSQIDTSIGPQTFYVYIRLHDETGGFPIHTVLGQGLQISMARLQEESESSSATTYLNFGNVSYASCAKVDQFYATSEWAKNVQKPSGCRVGGDRMDPLLRVSYTMPQFSKPGTYVVSGITFADTVRNSVNLTRQMCPTCGYVYGTRFINDMPVFDNAKVVQVGPGDVTPPRITSISYATSVDTSTSDQTIDAIVRATDDVGFNFANAFSSAVNIHFRDSNDNGFSGSASGVSCNTVTMGFNPDQSGCRISPGEFRVKIRIPQSAVDGVYTLSSAFITDGIGNYDQYDSCQSCMRSLPISALNSSGAIVKSGRVVIDPGPAPTLQGIDVETPHVNAGGSNVSASIILRIHDEDGFGASGTNISANFANTDPTLSTSFMAGISAFDVNNAGSIRLPNCTDPGFLYPAQGIGGGCVLSSNGKDFVIRLYVPLIAHAAKGTYSMKSMTIRDGKNTVEIFTDSSTPRPKSSLLLSDLNIPTPSFVNSY